MEREEVGHKKVSLLISRRQPYTLINHFTGRFLTTNLTTMIFQNLCYVTHTKLPRHFAITGILCYNSIIDKQQKEQNNLEFQVGNKKFLLTLYRALSGFVYF